MVDFLENSLAMSYTDIIHRIKDSPDVLLRRREEILGLLDEVWIGTSLESQRRIELPGQIWPVLPRSAPDAVSLAKKIFDTDARIGTPARDANNFRLKTKSLLIYAHGIHLPNPLRFSESSPGDGQEFLRAISQICTLAPLISHGVIRVFDPPPSVIRSILAERSQELESLAAQIGLALMSYEGNRQMHQGFLKQAGDILLQRAIDQLIDFAGQEIGAEGSLLLSTQYDRPAINALLQVLGRAIDTPLFTEQNVHQVRLEQLVALRLPGLRNIDFNQMITIRDDESFGNFRTDIAAALRDADADVRLGHIDAARRTIGEHMDAGVTRLNIRTRRGILGDSMLGPTFGWGIGSALASSIVGLKGLIVGLMGQVAADRIRKWPSAPDRALLAHYVELGTASLKSGHAQQIDFLAFNEERLWGPSLGEPRRRAMRQATVEDLKSAVESERPSERLSRSQVGRLLYGLEELLAEGDYPVHRLIVWISLILVRTCGEELDEGTRVRLAIAAGTAAEMGAKSLCPLAIRVIDPVLQSASQGELKVDTGELEELNLIRGRLNLTVGRHKLAQN